MKGKCFLVAAVATAVMTGQTAGGLAVSPMTVMAAEKSVSVTQVGSGGWESFMKKIQGGADYSSVDVIGRFHDYGDVRESGLYRVKVDETGILYITTSPTDGDGFDYTSEPLFTGECGTVSCTPIEAEEGDGIRGGNRFSYRVDPGTYYYKVVRENGYGDGENTYYTHVGFMPDGQTLVAEGRTIAKVNKIKAGAKKISGKGIVGSKVVVKTKGKTYKATVKKSGKWSVKVAKVKKGQKVKVYAKNGQSRTATNTIKAR